jgi:ABC-2 type transport system permease protein
MTALLSKLKAFLVVAALSASSYRLSFTLGFVGPIFPVIGVFFVDRMLGDASINGLQRFGNDYFSFAIVGVVFNTYMGVALGAVSGPIRAGQTIGFLEVILASRTRLQTHILGTAVYPFLMGTVFVMLFLVFSWLLLRADLSQANVPAAVVMVLVSMASVLGLGIISGAFVLAYKEGDPINLVISQAAFFLSGVIYPVEVLPTWLLAGSAALPHTYALEGMRLALLSGYSVSQLTPQIGPLLIFSLVTVPIGIVAFRLAMHRARVEGSFAKF